MVLRLLALLALLLLLVFSTRSDAGNFFCESAVCNSGGGGGTPTTFCIFSTGGDATTCLVTSDGVTALVSH